MGTEAGSGPDAHKQPRFPHVALPAKHPRAGKYNLEKRMTWTQRDWRTHAESTRRRWSAQCLVKARLPRKAAYFSGMGKTDVGSWLRRPRQLGVHSSSVSQSLRHPASSQTREERVEAEAGSSLLRGTGWAGTHPKEECSVRPAGCNTMENPRRSHGTRRTRRQALKLLSPRPQERQATEATA